MIALARMFALEGQDIAALAIVAGAIAFLSWQGLRFFKRSGKSGCASGCASCPASGPTDRAITDDAARLPIVQLKPPGGDLASQKANRSSG
jgi:hypothetical protein